MTFKPVGVDENSLFPARVMAKLRALFAARWQPNTTYAAGATVISPAGDAVICGTAHTSGSSFDDSKWLLPTRVATALANAAAVAAVSASSVGNSLLGVATALREGVNSFGIGATGDSTTTPDSAWFRLLANYVASTFPAYHHRYWKWNDSTQECDRPIALTAQDTKRAIVMAATGSANQRVGVALTGPTITADLDLRINLSNLDWTPGATAALIGRWNVFSDRSCQWWLLADGSMRLQWATTDPTTFSRSVDSTAANSLTDLADGWLRVVLDVDNGSSGHDVKFFTSTDGATWTQLGSTVTTSGVTTVAPGTTSNWTVGTGNGNALPSNTKIHEVQVRDGIAGAIVMPLLPEHWARTIGTYAPTIEGKPILDWVMGAMPGAGLGYDTVTTGYLMASDRPRKMLPNVGYLALFFSTSHNEYFSNGRFWIDKLSSWITAASGDKPSCNRIVLTQNPRTAAAADPATRADWGHRERRARTLEWARRAAIDVIDTYQAFLDDPRGVGALISDGVHPNTAGYIVWYLRIRAELDAALARVTATPYTTTVTP